MRSIRLSPIAASLMLAGALSACADMSPRARSTAVGAGIGAAAGAVITGSEAGTVGGAAVGGVIGNQVKK
jgi:osmotically inducible lipoprotein OsmB